MINFNKKLRSLYATVVEIRVNQQWLNHNINIYRRNIDKAERIMSINLSPDYYVYINQRILISIGYLNRLIVKRRDD